MIKRRSAIVFAVVLVLFALLSFSAVAANESSVATSNVSAEIKKLKSAKFEIEEYKELSYVVLENDTVQIVKYDGKKKNYTIPSKIDGKAVTVIGSHSFSSCPDLESLTIPGSVRDIHECAVAYCPKLKKITVKEGNLKALDSMDIYCCRNLETVSLPDNISSFTFLYDCSAVEKVTFDSNNPYYKSYDGVVFSKDLDTLVYYPPGKTETHFVVPSSVKTIIRTAFNYAKNLDSVYVPKTVKEIGETAFGYTSVIIYYEGAKTPSALEAAFNPWPVVYKAGPLDITEELSFSRTASSVTLKWKKVPGADGYRVYIYNKEEKKYETFDTVTKLNCKITDLEDNTSYKFAVKAYVKTASGTVWADESEKITVRTLPLTPGFTAEKKNDEINFRFNKVAGATGYVIYYSTSKNGTYKKLAAVKGTSYSTEKFDDADTYYFKVRAYTKTTDGNIYSAYSSVKSVTVK